MTTFSRFNARNVVARFYTRDGFEQLSRRLNPDNDMNEKSNVRSRLEFRLGETEADVIYRALKVEGEHQVPRTKVSLGRNGDMMFIEIEAEDSSSLRACINSYINWIRSLSNLMDTLK